MTSDRHPLGWLGAAAAFIAGIAYLYHPLYTSGMTSGYTTDTQIQIALLQNWSNCLSGHGSCLSPNYFYPLTGTLGYNDGYLISGLLFHCYRLLGLDPFIAHELVYVPIRLIGFVSVIALGVRFLKLPFWAAVLAASLSMVSLNLQNQIVHTQLIYAAFVPLGVLLLLEVLDRLTRLSDGTAAVWTTALFMLAFGLLCATWAATAFYSFFFFMIFTLLLAVTLAITRWRHLSIALDNWMRRPAIVVASLAGLALTPLVLWTIYGVTRASTGGHQWTAFYNPRIQDLFNVGPDSLIWSPLLAGAYQAISQKPMTLSELAVGFPILFLVGLVFCWSYLFGPVKRTADHRAAFAADHAGIAVAIGLASLLILLSVIRIGNGYTLWFLFWKVLPGAVAIRVPSRFFIFVTPLLCLILAYVMARLHEKSAAARRVSLAVIATLAVALMIEQYNIRPEFKVPWRSELSYFNSVPAPPAECRSFFVSIPRRGPHGSPELDLYYNHSVDAMLVAALHKIPTVNGMASFIPGDWNLEGPFKPDYTARVANYAQRHGISDGLCALDLKALRWTRP